LAGTIGISANANNILEQGFWYATADRDGDGVAELADNCPSTPNPGQGNVDGDALG